MGRRLATIAKEINAEVEGFTAQVVPGYCNTDRKIAGTRLIHPGKGREGNKIVVRNAEGNVVLSHNAAETYRTNSEVEEWLAKLKGVIALKGSKLRVKCPTCHGKPARLLGRAPFAQCQKCGTLFLGKHDHYGKHAL